MALCSLCTFLTPIAAQTSYIFLMVIRIILGIGSVSMIIFFNFLIECLNGNKIVVCNCETECALAHSCHEDS